MDKCFSLGLSKNSHRHSMDNNNHSLKDAYKNRGDCINLSLVMQCYKVAIMAKIWPNRPFAQYMPAVSIPFYRSLSSVLFSVTQSNPYNSGYT